MLRRTPLAPTEVAIIGAGIVGAASAYYLAKQGVPVTLLEKGSIAGEQSSRNWGFVRQQGRHSAELPLMIACNGIWQNLHKELAADLGWRQGGNLRIAVDDERIAVFESWQRLAAEYGLDTRILSTTELRDVVPSLTLAARGGMYTPSDGQADPTRVTTAFCMAARRLGARIYEHCAVTGVDVGGGAVRGVNTERGMIVAGTVVCAAGVWSSRLLRRLGLSLPTVWVRNSVARTEPLAALTASAVWMPEVAFRQAADGRVTIAPGAIAHHDIMLDSVRYATKFWQALQQDKDSLRLRLGRPLLDDICGRYRRFTTHRTLDPAPDSIALRAAVDCFTQRVAADQAVRVARSWAGYIDMTPDLLPVLDAQAAPSGLVVATGFSGHGFGLGPIAGRVVAEMATGRDVDADLKPFQLQRFSERATPQPII